MVIMWLVLATKGFIKFGNSYFKVTAKKMIKRKKIHGLKSTHIIDQPTGMAG